MTLDPLNLMEKVDYGGSDKVIVGNGSGLHIHHVGNSSFYSNLSNKSLVLNKLLRVPAITKNLLSVSQFAKDNHVFFEFHPNYCCVKNQDTKEIILQGTTDNGLYKFTSSYFKPALTPTAFLSSTEGSSSFRL